MQAQDKMIGRSPRLFVVSHTHWDREWYLPLSKFRVYLTGTLDLLLDLLRSDEYRHFMLDGQTIILEDYVGVKPDREKELRRRIKEGRISIGPWYVQPDEFLVSGEALIRNLLIGDRIGKRFGGTMRIGYLPDSFGHIAQLPQLLRGFGIDTFIAMRGMGNEEVPVEFWWRGLDGSRVLAIHLRHTYCNAGWLPPDLEGAAERIKRAVEDLTPHCSTSSVLLMNGCDHFPPMPMIPQIIERLRRDGHEAMHASLGEYVEAVKRDLSGAPEVGGELRGARYMPILPNVLSTRYEIKRENAETEYELRFAEFLAILASMRGRGYPTALMELAWKYHIQNHAHDSICGCSCDEVYRDVRARYGWAKEIARTVEGESVRGIVNGNDDGIVVFNPLSWRGKRVVRVDPVPIDRALVDGDGGRVRPTQEGVFIADPPACGWASYELTSAPAGTTASTPTSANMIENQWARVEALPDGFRVFDKVGDQMITVSIEDDGDRGDEYNYSPVSSSTPVSSSAPSVIVESAMGVEGGVFSSLTLRGKLVVPRSLREDRGGRNSGMVKMPITTKATLYKGIKRVEFETEIDNRARDYRIRARFSSDIEVVGSKADTPYGIVRRGMAIPDGEGWAERPTRFYPKQLFVEVSDDMGGGFMVAAPCLYEYEPLGDGVAVTLLRSVGWLWRDDLPERKSDMGIDVETPDAQCIGTHRFKYALILDRSYHHVLEYAVPCKTAWGTASKERYSLLKIEPKELIMTALKRSEDDDGIIIRLYNPTANPLSGRIELDAKVKAMVRDAWIVDLKEEIIGPADLGKLALGPFKIGTLKFVLDEKEKWRMVKPMPPVRTFRTEG